MTTKIKSFCTSCLTWKPLTDYYKVRRESEKRHTRCKECNKESFRVWYSKPENRKANIEAATKRQNDPKNRASRVAAYTKYNHKKQAERKANGG